MLVKTLYSTLCSFILFVFKVCVWSCKLTKYFLQVQCASLKITDCSQLMKEWPRDVILRDDVCTAQCGFFLRDSFNNFNIKTASALTQTSVSTGLIPPPTRTVRSRPVLPYFNSNTNPFNGFKFPDLTQFIV